MYITDAGNGYLANFYLYLCKDFGGQSCTQERKQKCMQQEQKVKKHASL